MARLLVVEDFTEAREALCEALSACGHEAHGATDGADALRQLAALPAVDVILLDIQMPVMDGPTFLAERRRRGLCAHVPVILLSAWADRRAAGEEVFARLTKPVSIAVLLEHVRAAIGGHREASDRP